MQLAELINAEAKAATAPLFKHVCKLPSQTQISLVILSVVYKPIGNKKFEELVRILVKNGLLPDAPQAYFINTELRAQLINLSVLTTNKEGLVLNVALANRLARCTEQLPLQGHNGVSVTLTDPVASPAGLVKPEPANSTQLHNLLTIIMAAEQIVPVINSYSWQKKDVDRRRVIRDCLLFGHLDKVEEALNIHKNPQIIDHSQNLALIEMVFLPFDRDQFLQMPQTLQYQAFATLIRTFQRQGVSCEYPISLLEQVCLLHPDPVSEDYNQSCHHLLAEQYLYQLRFDDFQRVLIANDKSSYALQLRGAYAFLMGDNKDAISYFEQAVVAKNKISRRKNQYLHETLGYFYKLALIVAGNQTDVSYFNHAVQQIEFEESDRKVNSELYMAGRGALKTALCLLNSSPFDVNIHYNCASAEIDSFCHQLNYMHYLLSHVWCNQSKDNALAELAERYAHNFTHLSYRLFSHICVQLQAYILDSQASILPTLPMIDVTKLITTKSQWDIALDKLIALNPSATQEVRPYTRSPQQSIRVIWELSLGYEYRLQAREQKLTNAGWSKGRTIALKRLQRELDSFAYFNAHDKKICKAISQQQGWGHYAKTEYSLQGLSALQAIVGADNVYLANDLSQPLEITQREPELTVSEQGDQLCLSIADLPDFIDEYEHAQVFNFKQLSDKHFQLTLFSADHVKVAEIIGEGGLLVPISAKQKALDGIAAIAPLLNIQSDVQQLDTGLQSVECDPHLIVNIVPSKRGLTFTCVVMPFGEQGPAFKPGIGNASLSHEINGKRLATQRNLLREQTLLDELDLACPDFLAMSDNVLVIDDLQVSLSILEQLELAMLDKRFALILRWPKGKKIKLSSPLQAKHLQLAMTKQSEWFDITGNLLVNDEEVIELRKLLNLVSTSNGRFIELGQEQVLALSQDLRHKLEQINQVTDDGKFHAFASLQVEQATSGMRMKTIHAWEQQTQKMHQANAIEPTLPSTFLAQLRDYQMVGFDWASRLAHWGAGACLADDMGLGKTLQALAVLLSRADKGPSLVIAPTSVCFNWHQESVKFSPTLNIRLFADSTNTTQRELLLNDLKPFDCVIISYGLLQRESELLKQVHWHTIVADEAQALKNPLAKRTKAAHALKADFKMITTGTPIENDLTELWSLFRFINPGLLGNLKRFAQRFSMPIENAKDDPLAANKASKALKTLIQPFILRRMKNQVLTELPSRTEINVKVEMSAAETAFYEALRLNAIDNISQNGKQANAGEQRIKMLAELVKLRQACCHPKLVMAESPIPSAKLAALDELLNELMANGHKALIFSQFVGHLQLIKRHIESKGLSYQYLDGSTNQKERQKRVNAFQSGQGDIFLISLKAGGFGLNLTAADYVIHMDPWWNPAVEQQASDRAHRMGQTRPVTIYRLISKNTIEEKIVALHQHKRDLADKLLAGNETASKLSVDDMLNLLQETF